MDAQGRGRAEEIDPADQWVLNPDTGDYELRLNNSGGDSARASGVSAPRGSGRRGAGREGDGARRGASGESGRRSREVPRQGGRRAAQGTRGQEAAADTSAGRRKRKAPKARRKKALLWTGGVMAFLLVAASAGGYWLYQHFNGNLSSVDIGDRGNKDVVTANAPLNILVIGTDKRTGEGNEGYGDKGSAGHADTNILFHVSKDRTNATAVSIPRDLMTNIPDCRTKQPDGSETTIPGTQNVRFNTSLGQDGRDPGCTMDTVKQLTGLSVDHFMMVDFNAVKTLSTAVGGVDICLAHAVKDDKSHLDLPAGPNTVQGEDALAFVRTRHAYTNGSDLDRIKGQQQFIGSMIKEMKSNDTLTSPKKLYKLADAATKALTVDSAINSVPKLTTLAKELTKIDTKNITFVTLPVIDNPAEPTPITVVVDPVKAPQLLSMMQEDTSLTEVAAQKKAAKSKQDALLKGTKAAAADVRVDVYNGGGIAGAAQQTVTWLQNDKGVLKSTNKANAPAKAAKTTLEYAPNQADQARALAEMMGLPASAMKPGTKDAVGLQAMVLTLGADFKGAGTPITGPTKIDIPKSSADKQVCAK
ncbi:LCP family protein [Streptomyces poriferorum]|uniref:LCP family protein n=1 Tax=Streptomyces poriferorum TaxID=2798799 RepID=A0ABY9ITE0_9ACTN|nr:MULTISPECIES: LCP family protein [Streptomyces]MBW5254088.1 LCP family protein [Streptomyces poriferorum]MBW5261794.1 LCP family protein [Streptomyces poriferorum]MDP5312329.1 LCP family protein [Streptomyces sp. Alt4]WLQ48697.1 LCP family protein [Streptomyces sp. Alt1]WLQ58626.1 LCP family protein [Streptomyces sp. Alt2]